MSKYKIAIDYDAYETVTQKADPNDSWDRDSTFTHYSINGFNATPTASTKIWRVPLNGRQLDLKSRVRESVGVRFLHSPPLFITVLDILTVGWINMFSKLETLYFNLKYGILNIIRWFPIIWRDRDWDWEYLAVMMQTKLERMANDTEKYGYHIGKEKDVKNMRLCVALIKRLREDEYFRNAGYDHTNWQSKSEKRRSWIAKHSRYMQKQDLEYLGKILGKYLNCWCY